LAPYSPRDQASRGVVCSAARGYAAALPRCSPRRAVGPIS